MSMKGQKAVVLGVTTAVGLFFSLWCGRCVSQTRGPQSPEEFRRQVQERQLKLKQDMEERQRRAKKEHAQWLEQTQKIRADYDDQAWQEALGATPEQWKVIKPKLGKVRNGLNMPAIRISIYSYAGTASYSTQAAGHVSGAGSPAADGAAPSPAARDANRPRTGIRHYAGSTGERERVGEGDQYAAGEEDAGVTSRVHSQAYATAGFGISGDVLTKPVKKRVGDVCLGWQWGRPSLHASRDKLSAGTRACEELLDTLERNAPDPEEVRRQVEALRKIREQKQAEYRQAREELRKAVTPEQEAKLILMGYLD
jgi:hypothetical protein